MRQHEPIGLLIAAVRRRSNRITAALAKAHRLSPQQFWTVVAVAQNKRLSLRELAERRRMDPPTASRIADALVKRGLLRNETGPSDRRRSRLALTRSGETLAGKLRPIAASIAAAAEGSLSRGEREAVVTGLEKMLSSLDRYGETLEGRRSSRRRKVP